MTARIDKTTRIPVLSSPEGKVPKAITQREAVEKAEMWVAKKLPKYLKKLQELAMGVVVVEIDKGGKKRIYTKAPDRAALEYLLDRGMGKAPQRLEMTGGGGGPMEFIAWAPSQVVLEEKDIIEGEARELGGEAQTE